MRAIHAEVVQCWLWKSVYHHLQDSISSMYRPLSFRLASSGGFNPVGGQHEDLFKVLGVSHSASEDQIRDAFRQVLIMI